MSTVTEEMTHSLRPGPVRQREGPVCAVCGEPVDVIDYSGQILCERHRIDLVIMGGVGDTCLPLNLRVHGDCLRDLRDKLRETNKGQIWL